MLPSAHAVLWSMASFLLLWGASLLWRGVSFGRGKRRCPACRRDVPPAASACTGCGFASDRESDFRGVRVHWGVIATAFVAVMGAGVAAYAGAWVREWARGWEQQGATLVGPWASAAFGMAVFGAVMAVWSWRGERSRGRKRCPKCWYDMSGGGLKCPECGHDAGALKHLYRPRRRRKAAVIGALIVLLSYGVWITPRVQRGGWVGAIPTTAMILGWRWLPDSVVIEGVAGAPDDWSLSGRMGDFRGDAPRLWWWQRAWVRARAEAAIARTNDVQVACRALVLAGPDGLDTPKRNRLLELLLSGMRDSRPHVRAAAAAWVPYVYWGGPNRDENRALVESRMDQLLAAVDDPADVVAANAMILIEALGPGAGPAVQRLAAAASNAAATPLRRNTAIRVWGALMHECPSARSLAAEWLRSSDPLLQSAVVQVYAAFLWSNPASPLRLQPHEVAALHALLRDGSDAVSFMAGAVLAHPPTDEAAVTALLDQAGSLRANRAEYLQLVPRCGPVAGIHTLRIAGFLSDPAASFRLACIEALRTMSAEKGIDVREAIPQLRACSADPDPAVVEAAGALLELLESTATGPP